MCAHSRILVLHYTITFNRRRTWLNKVNVVIVIIIAVIVVLLILVVVVKVVIVVLRSRIIPILA